MAAKKETKSYTELLSELQSVLDWFQASEVSVDQASAKYKQGMQLIEELEAKLSVAESEIVQLAKNQAS